MLYKLSMTAQAAGALRPDSFIRRYSVLAYFLLTFVVSWTGALAVAAPALLRGQSVSKISGILMFPAMLLGPSVSGIVMTRIVSRGEGVKDLFTRMQRARVPGRWYGVLLIPPVIVFAVPFLSEGFALAGVRAEPLLVRHSVWGACGFPGRDWMDGLCVSEDECEAQCMGCGDCAGSVLGNMALAGH
jgi:hypothetical protein